MKTKATNVINLKVISFDNGEEIGKVEDVVYDVYENKVKAILLDKGGWFSDAKIVFLNDVKSIGEDAVMLPNKDVIRKASEVDQEKISNVAKDKEYLTKTKVITENGNELGHVTDIFFDTQTGNVEDFELSGGTFENMKSGKKFIKVSDIIKIGKDATIVKSYTEDMIEDQSQKQGMQGMMNQAKDKFSEAKSQVQKPENQEKVKSKFNEIKENVKDAAQNIKDKAQESAGQAKDKAQDMKEKNQENMKEDLAGKYATRNILSENDEVILQRGDMVTHETIQKLEKRNLLSKLIGNVSEKPLKLM